MNATVTIVDYGMGNIRSLARALERAGAAVERTADPRVVERAERLAIPGQGAFHQAVQRLNETGLFEPVKQHINRGAPCLGVCLGLQVLFERSDEAPDAVGLGVVPGTVELLPVGDGIKRPHMGWAPVEHDGTHPVLAANDSGEAFYFVHSYAAKRAPSRWSTATTDHGGPFVAAVADGPVVGVQFHPEKSQDAGERLLAAWLRL